MAGLTVFIDEAGDEGYNIVPPPAKKASEWFLVGCAICPDTALDRLERGLSEPFHFRKEYHHRCVRFAETVAALPITAMVVVAHKPSMPPNAAVRGQKHYLFNYCTKLLLERVSWYCALNTDEPAKIIVSQRRKLSPNFCANTLHGFVTLQESQSTAGQFLKIKLQSTGSLLIRNLSICNPPTRCPAYARLTAL